MIEVQQERAGAEVPTVRIPDAALWWLVFPAAAALVLLVAYLLG